MSAERERDVSWPAAAVRMQRLGPCRPLRGRSAGAAETSKRRHVNKLMTYVRALTNVNQLTSDTVIITCNSLVFMTLTLLTALIRPVTGNLHLIFTHIEPSPIVHPHLSLAYAQSPC